MLEGKIIFPTSRWWAKSVHEIKSYCDFSVLFHRLFNLMKYIHNKIVVLFANLNISKTKQNKLKIESASLWVLDSIKNISIVKGGRPRKKLCFVGIWSAPLQGAESRLCYESVLLLQCACHPPTGTTVGNVTSVVPWWGGWGLVVLWRVGHSKTKCHKCQKPGTVEIQLQCACALRIGKWGRGFLA